ncbi:NAD-dependent malic enzyme [Planotetraspora sp. A-T 1434]|uniref:NAD-dependent malic enzyme n=1 Tax=Planotetraspora sp. A-T 1434 TaxID=2979219 RepID=UPI0021C167C8|nr:NAD-dependent malic enzyme [Planotetraspora sp. A-T 1434]MCT9932181.1 NAD-dependent malic enzyme [Planotetraspora sp. A-T 1434]
MKANTHGDAVLPSPGPAVTSRWNPATGVWETLARGRSVLADPRLNKGTAFTQEERSGLGLTGLVPSQVLSLPQQVSRAYAQYSAKPTDLDKNVYLRSLQDRNEVLFYRLLGEHLSEMLPIVYTPTVGTAIEHYSHQYRRPRGIYLSVDAPGDIERSLRASGLGADDVDLIVATDGEAILGIGDWGVGGMEISIGKLAVYTAAAGIDPARVIPVALDVGTNRQSLINDPLYLGNRHTRVDRATYDAFIDRFVVAVADVFPNALLHWEDFAADNARRIMGRYGDTVLTFNDDIQGTGAVNLAAVLSALRATGTPLHEQRVVVFGAGTAGVGIADQLRSAMISRGLDPRTAGRRFWALGRNGLLTDTSAALRDYQTPYARPADEVAGWHHDRELGGIGLDEVVRRIHPTVLIGTSGRGGAFTEEIVREMAAHTERPVILPMSNPTHLSEAQPGDLIRWTDGRALVATGSPFPPVLHDGITYTIGQANNALVFPGLGLGAVVAGARRITDGMLQAAAEQIAALAEPAVPGASILPRIEDLRDTSAAVAVAVARAAQRDEVARAPIGDDIDDRVRAAMWQPDYQEVRPI